MRRTLIAFFAVYLLLLVWLILYKFEPPYIGDAWQLARPWKLVPFFPSGDANWSNPLEVLANVAFFVPFGAYLAVLAPKWRWAVPVMAATSLALEIAQHLLSVGSFDSTDVIANTAGGLVGLLIARRIRPAVLHKVLIIGGVVVVLAVAAFIASPIHYAQPHDVVVR